MGKNSFGELMSLAQVMTSGMRGSLSVLAKRGIDEPWIANFESKMNSLIKTNNEQETIKATLKEKTGELDSGLSEFSDLMSQARKTIKMAMDQNSWHRFGILDSR
jgi:hypothetical protein